MPAQVLDGTATAAAIREEVRQQVSALGLLPGLGVVVVGDREDSAMYVTFKTRACEAADITTRTVFLPATCSEREVAAAVRTLGARRDVHGVLVQLPLPPHMNTAAVVAAIPPHKDVDGLLPLHQGAIAHAGGDREYRHVPCTAAGIVELLLRHGVQLAGCHAVVVGRSQAVGLPTAMLLLAHHATVTVAHSHTANLRALVRQADVLVVAAGRQGLVRGNWVKPGAVVVDAGIHRRRDASEPTGWAVVGDVVADEVRTVAAWLTPTPGGVGPMTIAMLVRAVANAARSTAAMVPPPPVPASGSRGKRRGLLLVAAVAAIAARLWNAGS